MRMVEDRSWKIEARRQKTEEREVKKDNRNSFGVFLLSVLFVFTTSCQDVKKTEKPENLIAKDMMVDILTEVYLSNAARSVNNKRLKEYNIRLDSVIYNKYHIDSLQFVESNAYYSSNLKTYAKIITSVEERLNILQIEKDSIYEIVKKEKEKEDSIKAKKKKEQKLLIAPVESGINYNLLDNF